MEELTGDSEKWKKIKGNSRKLHEFNFSEVGDTLGQTRKSIRFFNLESKKKLEKEETLNQSKFGIIFFPQTKTKMFSFSPPVRENQLGNVLGYRLMHLGVSIKIPSNFKNIWMNHCECKTAALWIRRLKKTKNY